MTVGDFSCYLRHLRVRPACKRIAWRAWGWGWVLFEGVLVDGLDVCFVMGRFSKRGFVDSGCCICDFGGYLVVCLDELCCPPVDVGGERLGLGLARSLFGGAATGSGVDDRKVFSDSKTR
ncbi:hypothetical protein H7J74_18235 [Mycobacterium angelicum]|nr:hypothetical protein [Mycobacterium angelicum]